MTPDTRLPECAARRAMRRIVTSSKAAPPEVMSLEASGPLGVSKEPRASRASDADGREAPAWSTSRPPPACSTRPIRSRRNNVTGAFSSSSRRWWRAVTSRVMSWNWTRWWGRGSEPSRRSVVMARAWTIEPSGRTNRITSCWPSRQPTAWGDVSSGRFARSPGWISASQAVWRSSASPRPRIWQAAVFTRHTRLSTTPTSAIPICSRSNRSRRSPSGPTGSSPTHPCLPHPCRFSTASA